MQIVKIIRRDFRSIPSSVKWVILMFSFWIFGWGFADPLFSLYLKSVIPNYAIIGILASIPNLMAMLFSIPIGNLEDHLDPNLILKYGLLGYVVLGIAYFLAGFFKIIPLLLLALFFNGIISAMVMVSARAYIKQKSSLQKASIFVGLLNMFFFGFYGLAMFLGFYGEKFYNLNSVFFVVSITSLISFLGLCKVFPAKKSTSNWRKVWHKIMQFEKQENPFTKVLRDFRKSEDYLYYALALIFFVGLVETMILTFMPLLADELGLNLGQISLLMGVMFLPYIFSFLFAEIADRWEKVSVTLVGLILSAGTMFFLYFATSNLWIGVLSALIAVSLALINPAAEGIITNLIPPQQR